MNARTKAGGIAALVACVLAALIIQPGAATAAPAASEQQRPQSGAGAQTPAAKAAARVTMSGGPRLQVQVGPPQSGPGAWQFTLERQSGTGWEGVGDYRTVGTKEMASIPVASGIYRIVVPAQNGHPATTSAARAYQPTPDITLGGSGALEVRVGPIRDWQVTLEQKTGQGWSEAENAKTRGVRPIVFELDAGTYRVRTEASGRFPAHTGDPFDFTPAAPAGPVPYGLIDGAFSGAPVTAKGTRAVAPRASSSNCASVMSNSSIGIDIAVGVINFIPYVGGSLGLAVADWSNSSQDGAEEACLSAQFATVNAQLAYQEAQIAQIQQELSEAKGEILQAFYGVDGSIANADLTAFTSDVNGLAQCGSGGISYDFMVDFGFWDGCNAVTSATVQGVATSSTFADQSTFGEINQTPFNQYLEGVSGSAVSCSGSLLPPAPGTAGPQCFNHVVPIRKQASQALAEALAAQLATAVKTNINAGLNEVPLFDQYNNALIGYYEQSVAALQSAFTVESLINQLNYYNAGQDPPIDSLGLVPGTYYSYSRLQSAIGAKPTATEQAEYYNRAQNALAHVYAARMNQLYVNTIAFLVTDAPAGGQAWPPAGSINGRINYANNVGKWVTTGAGAPSAASPLCMLPAAAQLCPPPGGSSNAALYQYFGLRNAGACYANILQWNKNNGTAVKAKNGNWYPTAYPALDQLTGSAFDTLCPPILTTSAGEAVSAPPTGSSLTTCATYAAAMPGSDGASCYDGDTLAPYYVAGGGLPESGSSVLANLVLCNSSDPSLTWFQVGSANAGNAAGLALGEWALTCGNWAAPAGPGFPGDAFPQSSPPSSWGDTAEFSCGSAGYCSGTSPTSFFGPFYATNYYCYSIALCSTGVPGYTFNTFYAPGYYGPQTQGSLPYVPPSTAVLLNIGGTENSTTMVISTPSCYSNHWTTGATVNTGSGCSVTFDPVSQQGRYGSATANLAALAVSLPNSATGSQTGGFSLPMTVGTVYGVPTQASDTSATCPSDCTLAGVWIASNTSVADVGYYAPASTVNSSYSGLSVSQLLWQQNGYITVADGSCWNINVGRNANNAGTISFNQVTPGSACAA